MNMLRLEDHQHLYGCKYGITGITGITVTRTNYGDSALNRS
jgi:hypothetical protein